MISPYNSLYTQAVTYTTCLELGEPVQRTEKFYWKVVKLQGMIFEVLQLIQWDISAFFPERVKYFTCDNFQERLVGEEQRFIQVQWRKFDLLYQCTYGIFLQNFVVMYIKCFLSSKYRKEKPHIIILVTLETKNWILHILISYASAENIKYILVYSSEKILKCAWGIWIIADKKQIIVTQLYVM